MAWAHPKAVKRDNKWCKICGILVIHVLIRCFKYLRFSFHLSLNIHRANIKSTANS